MPQARIRAIKTLSVSVMRIRKLSVIVSVGKTVLVRPYFCSWMKGGCLNVPVCVTAVNTVPPWDVLHHCLHRVWSVKISWKNPALNWPSNHWPSQAPWGLCLFISDQLLLMSSDDPTLRPNNLESLTKLPSETLPGAGPSCPSSQLALWALSESVLVSPSSQSPSLTNLSAPLITPVREAAWRLNERFFHFTSR